MDFKMTKDEAMKLALEALENVQYYGWGQTERDYDARTAAITALRKALALVNEVDQEQPAQQEPIHVPVTDNTYNYAKSLAEAIFKQHFASDEHYASGRIVWGVNDTVIGILTQIDNMAADMVRRPAQQQEPGRNHWEDGDVFERIGAMKKQPAQQEPVDSTQISKVWWDGEKLMAKPIPFVEFYKPAQRTWVGLTDEEIDVAWNNCEAPYGFAEDIEAKLKEKNCG